MVVPGVVSAVARLPLGMVNSRARQDERAQLLMSVPGVGALISLTFVSAIDDPARFRSSRTVGAHLGLTQRKYQSGETDITGRISKCGDREVRTALSTRRPTSTAGKSPSLALLAPAARRRRPTSTAHHQTRR